MVNICMTFKNQYVDTAVKEKILLTLEGGWMDRTGRCFEVNWVVWEIRNHCSAGWDWAQGALESARTSGLGRRTFA